MESVKFSIYKNIYDNQSTTTLLYNTFLEYIKTGKWEDQVHKVRIIKDYAERKKEKEKMPYVTISGFFAQERKASLITAHTGYLAMDIDNIPGELDGTKTMLSADSYVNAIFTSVSGTGLCVIFKIDKDKHKEAFESISDYLLKTYQIIVDPSCKDVSRPRYVSYDPDLYYNEQSILWKKYLPKQKPKKIISTIFVQTEFDEVINQMVKHGVSCVDDYREWVSIGFGLADHFGERGRDYFHALSGISNKYEKSICDKQFTHCLKANGSNGKITIATIYYYAKQAGINIFTEKTKRIAAVTSSQKKAGLSAQQIAENLEKFEGIPKQDADDILKQVFQSNQSFTKSESIVDNIRIHLRHTYSLKRNIITRKIENNGKILDENDLNTMFLDAKVLHNELTADLFLKVIFSNNTQNYNPLLDWFENNKAEPQGVIDAFFGSFNTSDDICYLGKKWLVGVISAIHGVHSPLMLILAGEKQGTGKTEAFRRMLPTELRQYYAESKLDAGKDDEILMTQKLIIMDDEMGGKSKKESKRLKELTSKQTFTLREPYGKMNVDLNRLAVLCGTTNDMQILNDPTGNRRLIPIQIRSIDYKKYNEVDKRLLLIEAYNLWKSGYEWQLTSEDVESMQQNNNKFEEFSIEYELINKYFRIPNESWLIEMSATEIKIHLEDKSKQKISLKRIGMELKRMGFESTIKKVNGKTIQVYSVMETTQNIPKPDSNLPF
jgi:predicted P-loop ATPase